MLVSLARAQPAPLASETRALTALSGGSLVHDACANGGTYPRVVAEAVAEYQAGRWAEARALFLCAHTLRPSARTFRTLGMTAFELREYPDAVRELSAALSDARSPLGEAHRGQVRDLLARAEIFVGRYQIHLDPRDADLFVDGVGVKVESDDSVLLAVGRHELEARALGHAAGRRTVIVDGRDGDVLTLALPLLDAASSAPVLPALSPSVLTPYTYERSVVPTASTEDRADRSQGALRDFAWTWAGAGVAVVSGASSLALHLRAVHEDEQLARMCAADECYPHRGVTDKRDELQMWSRITLATSLAFAVGAAVLYAIERRVLTRRLRSSAARPAQFGLAAGYASDCRIGSKP